MAKESNSKLKGSLIITLVSLIVFSLGFLPLVIYAKIILLIIPFDQIWHLFLIPFIVYIGIVITIYYQLLFSGIFVHIFNIKYEPGEFHYNYNDKNSLRWVLICVLYTPLRKLLEIFPLGNFKNRYYRLLGMKIGVNSLIGGTIMDPCLTEVGDNCTIGLYSVIYGHIHVTEEEKLITGKIKIGNNCIIGAGAFIMPGAILEDNVKLASGAVVRKGQVLKKGKIYGGIPAKEIKKSKN